MDKKIAVITTKKILDNNLIKVVIKDNDGDWQFLDGGVVTAEDAVLLSLQQVIDLDPSIISILDMPLGYRAVRTKKEEVWIIEKH